MNEMYKQILRSIQYAKKYIIHCFANTSAIVDYTESQVLNKSEKSAIKQGDGSFLWNGYTLTIVTLLQSLIIFEPIIDKDAASKKNIKALNDENEVIFVSLHDLRNCLAHNISEKFFSKVNQQQFVFSSRIDNIKTDYTITFKVLSEAMGKLEHEIEKVII